MFLVIAAYSLFCLITLGGSDEDILGVGAQIELPFAGVRMTAKNFVIVGPLILIALTAYMHLFISEWRKLDIWVQTTKRSAYFFNFDGFAAKLLTNLAFYWLTPVLLCFFFWKALPLPISSQLMGIVVVSVVLIIWLSIRRCMGESRLYWNLPKWMTLAIAITFFVSVQLASSPWSRPLYLSGSVLEGKDLREFNLRGADLTNANLKNAKLSQANLSHANLTGAMLSGTNFESANLENAILVKASGENANFKGTNMIRAEGHRANFENCDFSRADLSQANLQSATLMGSNFQGAVLSRADLRSTVLQGTDFQKATFDNTLLDNASFEKANLRNAIFFNVDLQNAQGMTSDQFELACVNNVNLPSGIVLNENRPDTCPPAAPTGFIMR
jgi:uncharacterized protein YjbI with pentapeptide repeats